MRTNLKCSNLLIFLFVLAIVNISVYTQLVNSFNKDSDFITLSNILKSSKVELPKRRHNHHYSKINSLFHILKLNIILKDVLFEKITPKICQ